MSEELTHPDWMSWDHDAFVRAQRARKPVLLMLATRWSRGCAEMRRTTYCDPDVVDSIEKHFVPVWVDADERPDIADRYGLGGWPTTAFLTPDGRLLGGQRFTEPRAMADLLLRVARAFAARGDELMTPPPASSGDPVVARTPGETPPAEVERLVVNHLREAFDHEHGGFGRAAKQVEVDALVLAAALYGSGDDTMGPIIRRTLDAIGWSPIFDDAAGGVYRCCARRDWSEPSPEKLLEVNASALRAFLEGGLVLDEPRYHQRATDVVIYARGTLADRADHVFFASEQEAVDQAVYTTGNAQMARAFLRASEVLGDSSLSEFAIGVLDHVAGDTYRPGDGVSHRVDEPTSVRGLLCDQVALSEALLDAYQIAERDAYLDLAQELMLFSMRRLWNEGAGVFVDRVVAHDDIGLLRQTLTPFSANCRTAAVLSRLARVTERAEFADRAQTVLRTLASRVAKQSVDAASYVLALHELSPQDPS